MLVFPQIGVDSRKKQSAEGVVHRFDGNLIRVVLRRSDIPHHDDGLLRARLVHHVHDGLWRQLDGLNVFLGRLSRLPA